mgnify:CR=1 FL=1
MQMGDFLFSLQNEQDISYRRLWLHWGTHHC